MNQISTCRCSSEMCLTKHSTEGLFEQWIFFCNQCKREKKVSNSSTVPVRYDNKKGRGYKPINVLVNVAVNTSGLTYQNFSDFFHAIGLSVPPKSGFHTLSKLVWKTAMSVANQNFTEVLNLLKENDSHQLVLCGDGAWAHRGWTSSQGCYIVWDAIQKCILKVFTFHHDRTAKKKSGKTFTYRHATTDSTSGGMEADGILALIMCLQKANLLSRVHAFVIDKDTKVSKLVRDLPNTSHIKFFYDPGHVTKNFGKSLTALFGKSQLYEGFSSRIAKWFLRTIKLAEEDAENMFEIFDHQ